MIALSHRQPVLLSIIEVWTHISPNQKSKLLGLFFLMLLTSVMELVSIGALIPFIHALLDPSALFQNKSLYKFFDLIGIYSPDQLLLPMTIMFSLAIIISRLLSLYLLKSNLLVAHKIGSDLSCKAYFNTLYQPYEVHIERNAHVIGGHISGKVSNIIAALNYCLTIATACVSVLIISIGLLFINPLQTAIVIIFGCLFYVTITFFGKMMVHKNSLKISSYTDKMNLALQHGLGGIRDILIDGSQAIFFNHFKRIDVVLRAAQGQNQFAASAPRFLIELFGMLLICWVAFYSKASSIGSYDAFASLGVLIFSAQKLLPSFHQIYASWSGLVGGCASVREVLGLLNQPMPLRTEVQDKYLEFKREIIFKNISFIYKNSNRQILSNINFSIHKGERVGIIGASGSGKSTLLDIFMGLLSPTTGGVFVDDLEVDANLRSCWMRKIAHVPQNIYLADASILENIAFGVDVKDIDMNRIHDVIFNAQLMDFINQLPMGLDTRIGQGGLLISGGQRQRLGLARAFYKDAEILILDEATSALDENTENQIVNIINAFSRDITLIIISHRPSALRGCDRILSVRDSSLFLEHELLVI